MCQNHSPITHEIDRRNWFFQRPESTTNYTEIIDLGKRPHIIFKNHPIFGGQQVLEINTKNWDHHESSEIIQFKAVLLGLLGPKISLEIIR